MGVDNMEKMTREDEMQIRETMRERYCAPKRVRRLAPPPVDTLAPTKWDS